MRGEPKKKNKKSDKKKKTFLFVCLFCKGTLDLHRSLRHKLDRTPSLRETNVQDTEIKGAKTSSTRYNDRGTFLFFFFLAVQHDGSTDLSPRYSPFVSGRSCRI